MKCLIVCLVALITAVPALRVVEQDTNPVTRVVTLLETLANDLKVDGKAEEKMYMKYACWCKDQLEHYASMIQQTLPRELREQTGLVQEADMHIGVAIRVIAESEKTIAERTKDNGNLENSLNKAYAKLQKDNSENYESMAALKDAIAIFADKAAEEGGSLLQMSTSTMNVFRKAMMKLPDTIQIPEKDVALLSEFSKTGSLYAPQHGPILGMMKSMFMNLAQDIEKGDAVYMQLAKSTETFIYDNNLLMAKAKAAIARHTENKLKFEAQKAAAEEEIVALTEELEHSKTFFRQADIDCRETKDNWNVRRNLREEEARGVRIALKILKKQRDLFDKSIQAGLQNERDNLDFLQLSESSSMNMRRAKAVDVLSIAARRTGSLDLAQLAVSLKNPGTDGTLVDVNETVFDTVSVMIDDIIKELKQQDKDDIAERDGCIEDLHTNSERQKQLKWDIEKLVEHYAALNHTKQELADKEAALEAELDATIAENAALMEARNESHHAILQSISDDEEALLHLKNATEFLASYYKEHAGAFVQKASRAEPVFTKDNERAPENDFSGKGSRGNQAKTILALMKHIQEDMENEIQTSKEQDAHEQFEFNKQQTLLDQQADNLHAQLVIVDEQIADNDAAIIQVESDLDEAGGPWPYVGGDITDTGDDNSLKTLMIEHNEINNEEHTQSARSENDGVDNPAQYRGCERALAIFEKRRDKRKIEVEALTSAKALLAGDLSQAN